MGEERERERERERRTQRVREKETHTHTHTETETETNREHKGLLFKTLVSPHRLIQIFTHISKMERTKIYEPV